MAAPKGNQFWKARSSHGRKPIFKTPEELWSACEEYFEWVEDNPLWEVKPFAFQGVVTQEKLPKMRAMTIIGMCTFLDINQDTWYEYGKKEGFSEVFMRAGNIIRDQKFAGAAAELLNPAIIAKDLGLSDKHEVSGPNGGPVEVSDARNRLLSKLAPKS